MPAQVANRVERMASGTGSAEAPPLVVDLDHVDVTILVENVQL
jgi:hypothetical protein